MKKILYALLLPALFCVSSYAQIRYRAVCFEPVSGLESVFLREGSQMKEIKLPSDHFTPQDKYSGGRNIVFVKQELKDGRYADVPVAQAKVQDGVNNVILLFIASSEEEKKSTGMAYQIVPIPEADSSFREGSVRFVNLSPNVFKWKIGEFESELGPRKINTFTASKLPSALSVFLSYKDTEFNEWRPLSSTNWTFTSGRRVLLFVYYDKEEETVRTKGITDGMSPTVNQ